MRLRYVPVPAVSKTWNNFFQLFLSVRQDIVFMDKKKIWIIIILMSAAMIGSILVQLYWIKLAKEENEKQFKEKVIKALTQVSDKLNQDESGRGPWGKQFDREGMINDMGLTLEEFEREQLIKELDVTLEERLVDLNKLDKYIKNSLAENGIRLKYNYGVAKDSAFIIIDNNFVFQETRQPDMSQVKNNESLYDSEYEVGLFYSEFTGQHSGRLRIFFPSRNKFVWADIIPFLIASIVFTSLILISFSYTIYVIFRQKKISEIKTDFINNMTHEFKTPIATISLATDSILSPMILSHPDKIKRFTQVIKQENARMLSQVEKVLQMAQIEKQTIQLKITSIDLHELIHTAVDHINLQLQAKGGHAETQLSAPNPVVEGDLTHISNMIHNLLDNANKYTPDAPRIIVSTSGQRNGVKVSVADNGIGISKEAKKRIFEKFYRVPTGNIHDVKGFGLGLAYVKAMMLAHGGNVEVKSELGKGSVFTLFFPFRQEVKI